MLHVCVYNVSRVINVLSWFHDCLKYEKKTKLSVSISRVMTMCNLVSCASPATPALKQPEVVGETQAITNPANQHQSSFLSPSLAGRDTVFREHWTEHYSTTIDPSFFDTPARPPLLPDQQPLGDIFSLIFVSPARKTSSLRGPTLCLHPLCLSSFCLLS